MILAPFIAAFEGGDFGGDPSGFNGGSFGGDPNGFNGGSFAGDPSGFNGGITAGSVDGFNGGLPGDAVTPTSTGAGGFDSSQGSNTEIVTSGPGTASGPGFSPGPDGFPPGGNLPGGPGGFPPNVGAIWQSLADVTIFQGTPSGTIIQHDVTSKCHDPDDSTLVFGIASSSSNYEVRYVNNDLRIFNLKPTFVGTETITLTCNNVPESFFLHVITQPSLPTGEVPEENDVVSVHIGAIHIPNAYDANAGDIVPVIITFKNDGDKKLENLDAAVVILSLGVRASVGPMDVAVGKTVTRTLYIELPPDTAPGTYDDVEITMDSTFGSSSLHRVVHRDIDVIS